MNGVTIGTSVSVYREGEWLIEPFTIDLCAEICLSTSGVERDDVRRIDIHELVLEQMGWIEEQTHYEYNTQEHLFTIGKMGEEWMLIVYDNTHNDLLELCCIMVNYIDQVQEVVYLYSEEIIELQ